jgi:signal transduction histidine kinase/PAS domain-containing protein
MPDPHETLLNKLLVMQSLLHAAPDLTWMGEVLTGTCAELPGVLSAALYLDNQRVAEAGSDPRPVDWPEVARREGGAGPDEEMFEELPIETAQERFGALWLALDDREAFVSYRPYVENALATVALLIENRTRHEHLVEMTENLNRLVEAQVAELKIAEGRYRELFENSEVSIWDEDLTAVYDTLQQLRQGGLKDLRAYLEEDRQRALRIAATVVVKNVNRKTLELFGAGSREEMLRRIEATFGAGAAAVFIDELCAIWDGQSSFQGEALYTALDGSQIRAIIAFVIPASRQGFASVPVNIIDISSEWRAAQLREARLRLDDKSLHRDASGFIRCVLDEAETLTGSQISFFHFVHDDEKTLSLQLWSNSTRCSLSKPTLHSPVMEAGVWADCLKSRQPVIHNDYATLPQRRGLPEGHLPLVRVLVVPLIRDGRVSAIIGVGNKPTPYGETDSDSVAQLADTAWDTILYKLAEDERARLNDRLRAKNKQLEQVVHIASHDLRSPLVNINGYSSLLHDAVAKLRTLAEGASLAETDRAAFTEILSDEIEVALGFIGCGTATMERLLASLLKLSRLLRLEPEIVELEMNELIAELLSACAFELREADAEVKLKALPRCVGDRAMVTQIFSNLISNAIKYRHPERPLLLRIEGRPSADGTVEYCVEDNGVGIDREHQQNIFSAFHRLNPGQGDGEGLGLNIVQNLVGSLAGRVRVESEPGQGSRFCVNLPQVLELRPAT